MNARERAIVLPGDCLEELRAIPDGFVDAVVTDPPYALEFMGRAWDRFERGDAPGSFQHWCELWARECLRVLKPGGHLLAFGGSRTWHRLAAGIEDAGFEMRDSIAWLYGSGFPKSLDVSKAIDKAAGATREVVGAKPRVGGWHHDATINDDGWTGGDQAVTAPATPDAERWQGWGTALKPAFEPIVVARKPLVGTVAANVLAHGTGALNIDETRIGMSEADADRINNMGGFGAEGATAPQGAATFASAIRTGAKAHAGGRWPANVVLDEDQAAAIDAQSGTSRSAAGVVTYSQQRSRRGASATVDQGNTKGRNVIEVEGYGDSGGASRFFYVAKAPKSERPVVDGVAHPTVKPLSLMRWLCRLVTPPDGIVLEPFAGSGTTVEAALLEGFRCIAIEREAEYLPLIEARLARVEGGRNA